LSDLLLFLRWTLDGRELASIFFPLYFFFSSERRFEYFASSPLFSLALLANASVEGILLFFYTGRQRKVHFPFPDTLALFFLRRLGDAPILFQVAATLDPSSSGKKGSIHLFFLAKTFFSIAVGSVSFFFFLLFLEAGRHLFFFFCGLARSPQRPLLLLAVRLLSFLFRMPSITRRDFFSYDKAVAKISPSEHPSLFPLCFR